MASSEGWSGDGGGGTWAEAADWIQKIGKSDHGFVWTLGAAGRERRV